MASSPTPSRRKSTTRRINSHGACGRSRRTWLIPRCVAAWRFRRLIADTHPVLEAFDEKLWATNLGYNRRHPADSLKSFLQLRAENHDLLNHLVPEYFDKAGSHAERGRVTLRDMVRINADHAEKHAARITKSAGSFQVSFVTCQMKQLAALVSVTSSSQRSGLLKLARGGRILSSSPAMRSKAAAPGAPVIPRRRTMWRRSSARRL